MPSVPRQGYGRGVSEPVLRVATPDDEAAFEALMKESGAAHSPQFYDEVQAGSAVRHIAHSIHCCSRTVRISSSRVTARRSPAVAGAGAASSTRAAAMLQTTRASSIRKRSRPAYGRCSSVPTGPGAASAGESWRRARLLPERRDSLGWCWSRRLPACRSTRRTGSARWSRRTSRRPKAPDRMPRHGQAEATRRV